MHAPFPLLFCSRLYSASRSLAAAMKLRNRGWARLGRTPAPPGSLPSQPSGSPLAGEPPEMAQSRPAPGLIPPPALWPRR